MTVRMLAGELPWAAMSASLALCAAFAAVASALPAVGQFVLGLGLLVGVVAAGGLTLMRQCAGEAPSKRLPSCALFR